MKNKRLTKFTKAKGSAAWKAMPRSRAASATMMSTPQASAP